MKIYIILISIIIALVFLLKLKGDRIDDLTTQTKHQQSNIFLLQKQIKEWKANEVALGQRITELEAAAEKDIKNNIFNWNVDISNTNLIRKLKEK